MTFKYLDSPYSHPLAATRELRYRAARDATAWLLRHRIWTYSPIVHCHDLAAQSGMPTDFEFWGDYNHAMIDRADELLVLTIEGWKESVGVNEEITYAADLGLPIRLMTFNSTTHPPSYAFKGLVVRRDEGASE
jgi:Domain of unknown function (DUF1937)